MSVRDKLESLDQAILNQYEKVTQVAQKRFGLNKYDLVRACDKVSITAYSGAGVYFIVRGVIGSMGNRSGLSTGLDLILGGFASYISYKSFRNYPKMRDSQQDVEEKLLLNEVRMPINNDTSRPLYLSLGTLLLGLGISQLIYGSDWIIPKSIPEADRLSYGNAQMLIDLCLGATLWAQTSAKYFRNTTMFPPGKSKQPIWKRALNYVTSPFRAKPQLEPEPVKEYRSIDEVVE